MNEKIFSIALFFGAMTVFLGFVCSIPWRKKRILNRAGKLLFSLPSESASKTVAIFFVSAIIIALVPFQRFQPFAQAILCFAAIFGSRFATNQAISLKRCGIYENALIYSGEILWISDIYSLPTISYENQKETVGVDKTQLEMILKSGRKISLAFSDEKTRATALDSILSVRPDLKS